MRILVVDDEAKVLQELVVKIRNGWESEGVTDDLEIEQAGSVKAVAQLIEDHQDDKDWVLDHVFSDGLAKPGGWEFGCEDVSRLVQRRGPNGTSPGMTVISLDHNLIDIANGLPAGFIYKPAVDNDPSLLIRRLLPPKGGPLEIR